MRTQRKYVECRLLVLVLAGNVVERLLRDAHAWSLETTGKLLLSLCLVVTRRPVAGFYRIYEYT